MKMKRDITMRTETVSFLKKHAADLPLDDAMTITQNGKPIYVVESYEERQRRDQAIALMKLVSFGREDMTAGRTTSSDKFKERLAARKSK
ncbi:hypothetical protein VIBHAR_p08232 (plasmid) [Vibrio campbellii ATCC BAA-1116]|jgi:hypothetical protein|uniref:Prevent-host-death protein n=3 Tax=Vibrio harveyi group TaxID=717610 RepID=A7N8U2_VIBC1|nr:hypothetical protein VIBHAR_p08232 [Vibrio campbellii ATCC BAA-1116]